MGARDLDAHLLDPVFSAAFACQLLDADHLQTRPQQRISLCSAMLLEAGGSSIMHRHQLRSMRPLAALLAGQLARYKDQSWASCSVLQGIQPPGSKAF